MRKIKRIILEKEPGEDNSDYITLILQGLRHLKEDKSMNKTEYNVKFTENCQAGS